MQLNSKYSVDTHSVSQVATEQQATIAVIAGESIKNNRAIKLLESQYENLTQLKNGLSNSFSNSVLIKNVSEQLQKAYLTQKCYDSEIRKMTSGEKAKDEM